MKKVIIGITIALLAVGAAGCSKEKKVKAAAPDAAEQLVSIEVQSQMNDGSASDPSTALTCKYAIVQNNGGTLNVSKAELKTSGKCDFAALKGQASAAGSISSNAVAQVMAAVSADNLPASVKAKWDCTAYNIKTNVRKAGAQDCKDGQGINDATAKAIAAALGL